MFCCVVMGANARRCSRTQNEIIASKRELPVKTLNIRILMYLRVTTLHYCSAFCTFTLRKGILCLRDSVKYFDYFRVTLSCNSVYCECVERY